VTLTVESVMAELAPMLKRGRPKKPGCRCPCGETDPARFGVNRHQCLPCGRGRAARVKLDRKREADFSKALETLALINSFPTREAFNHRSNP
jgi:hypothetical protein